MVKTRFDVFLSHSSRDKTEVTLLAQRLQAEGLSVFLDKWHLVPGESWQKAISDALDRSRCTAVFFGSSGTGAWHNEELQVALSRAARMHDDYRVIPVLLPGCRTSEISSFLAQRTWVDFRGGLDDESVFRRLVCAIKGEAPENGITFQLPSP